MGGGGQATQGSAQNDLNSGMARFEQAPQDFGDLSATVNTTFLGTQHIDSNMLGFYKGNTNRTCIYEFEVRYSTIELYP
jgi:hypothetical protein